MKQQMSERNALKTWNAQILWLKCKFNSNQINLSISLFAFQYSTVLSFIFHLAFIQTFLMLLPAVSSPQSWSWNLLSPELKSSVFWDFEIGVTFPVLNGSSTSTVSFILFPRMDPSRMKLSSLSLALYVENVLSRAFLPVFFSSAAAARLSLRVLVLNL